MKSIEKSILIAEKRSSVFKTLLTPSDIIKWWEADYAMIQPQREGYYIVSWGKDIDNPEYTSVAEIKDFIINESFKLENYKYSADGSMPDFSRGFTVVFKLYDHDNHTLLTVEHHGFPENEKGNEFYNACVKGWNDTLNNIKSYIED
ncbi:SRPBCC family protein [Mangrovivirga cuniculi]|uniref:Activator of Hsp90 ATPase homologue 1/2-like C-terminal domain-containing protein n=1 Tax=Mangrovivirga cuniculi TaxID=2715131 RepID=A0A4D7JIP8_9BACT|nr:SRPBCC domain-containing protein [Mangrovivirga cuniculi]QCK14863.1 hypothetical protein DCC35_08970 [Mangrovivirga cuniculi]